MNDNYVCPVCGFNLSSTAIVCGMCGTKKNPFKDNPNLTLRDWVLMNNGANYTAFNKNFVQTTISRGDINIYPSILKQQQALQNEIQSNLHNDWMQKFSDLETKQAKRDEDSMQKLQGMKNELQDLKNETKTIQDLMNSLSKKMMTSVDITKEPEYQELLKYKDSNSGVANYLKYAANLKSNTVNEINNLSLLSKIGKINKQAEEKIKKNIDITKEPEYEEILKLKGKDAKADEFIDNCIKYYDTSSKSLKKYKDKKNEISVDEKDFEEIANSDKE